MMKMNHQWQTIALAGVPLVVIVAGFIAYYTGFYDTVRVTEMPLMAMGMFSLTIVVVYQQFVIRELRADDTRDR